MAKIDGGTPQTLAPLATLAGGEWQIDGGTPSTLATLATLAGEEGQNRHGGSRVKQTAKTTVAIVNERGR
jgi:hypothetical protein